MAVYTETKTYHTKAHMGMIDVTEDFHHAVEEAARQILVSKRSREAGEKARLSIKSKSLAGSVDIANRVQKFVDCRTKEVARRDLYIVEGCTGCFFPLP